MTKNADGSFHFDLFDINALRRQVFWMGLPALDLGWSADDPEPMITITGLRKENEMAIEKHWIIDDAVDNSQDPEDGYTIETTTRFESWPAAKAAWDQRAPSVKGHHQFLARIQNGSCTTLACK